MEPSILPHELPKNSVVEWFNILLKQSKYYSILALKHLDSFDHTWSAKNKYLNYVFGLTSRSALVLFSLSHDWVGHAK